MSAQPQLLIQSIKDVTIVDFVSRQLRDLPEIEKIGEVLYDLVDNRNARKLILDFSKVQIFSSQVLGVLIKLREKLGHANSRMVLCGISPSLRQLLDVSRLARLFDFCDDEESALTSLGITSAG